MLRVTREGPDVIVENAYLVFALRHEQGAYRQYFYVKEIRDPILRSEVFGPESQGLITPLFHSLRVVEGSGSVLLELRGTDRCHRFTGKIRIGETDNSVHIQIEDQPVGPIAVESVASSYRLPAGPPAFVFAPYIRPFDDTVIGQSAFKSPVVAWLAADVLIYLVVDTDQLNAAKPPIPAYLDCDGELDEPRIAYGLATQKPAGFFYFRHTPAEAVDIPDGMTLSYAYYLVAEKGVRAEEAAGKISRFVWDRLAATPLKTALPQVVPLETYAERGLRYAIGTLWTEFTLEGKQCGGIRSGLRYPNDIWFQNQHDGLESALGLHYLGELWKDEELLRKARCVKNLILASPSQRGLFSTVFTGNVRFGVFAPEWKTSSHWMSTDIVREFSTVAPQSLAGLVDWERVYHTVSVSTAAHKMLDWYQEAEADPALVERCRAYGDHLLNVQQRSGAIPSFIYRDTFEVDTLLMDSVDSACSGLFLAELYRVTREQRYLAAAIRVAEFILRDIRPAQRWQDYETNLDSLAKPIGFFDRHTRQYAQTCGGIYWTSEMLRTLFEVTGAEAWLIAGTQIADYLSLFQAVWSPHFLSMYCFGGLAVGNSHPAWSDARQQQVGRSFLRYYRHTHDSHYFTRGVAAIRAGLPLMFMPENQRVSRHYANGPEGVCIENYAHRGEDKAAITCCSDWGLGNLLPTLALLLKEYGTVAVDCDKGEAFGVDGAVVRSCIVTNSRIELSVDDEVGEGRPMVVTVLGGKERTMEVVLNGKFLGGGTMRDGRLRLGESAIRPQANAP